MWLLTWAGWVCLAAQEPSKPPETEPPEEDESHIVRQYAFNPLQAAKELRIGGFYFKKGSYKAAAARFLEATKWNPKLAEAYLRLGEAREKLKDDKGAREAYARFLELAPNAKEAATIRKKLPEQ